MLPDFALEDAAGRDLDARTSCSTAGRSCWRLFRGGWCPYCDLTMVALEEARPAIEALGAQAVGIMPGPPRACRRDRRRARHRAIRCSAIPANGFARTCGLAYELSPDHIRIHLERGRDFRALHGDTTWRLPVPAVFVVEPSARVAFAFADVDPARWPDPEELLALARRRCAMRTRYRIGRHSAFQAGARGAQGAITRSQEIAHASRQDRHRHRLDQRHRARHRRGLRARGRQRRAERLRRRAADREDALGAGAAAPTPRSSIRRPT